MSIFNSPDTSTTFRALGISRGLCEEAHSRRWYEPARIQQEAIPHILAGKDLIGLAQTGSGKTGAFGLPMIEMLSRPNVPNGIVGLVLAPTRELAEQTKRDLDYFAFGTRVRVLNFTGGIDNHRELYLLGLKDAPAIVVGTLGRIKHYSSCGHLDLSNVQMLCLDEFDSLVSRKSRNDTLSIVGRTPSTRQTLLFSATMPLAVEAEARALLKNPITIKLNSGLLPQQIEHIAYRAGGIEDRYRLLQRLLARQEIISGLVFVRSKCNTPVVRAYFENSGFSSIDLNGNLTQSQRTARLEAFKSGQVPFLVTTDIVGRGIDFEELPLVLNFDFPYEPADYTHRAGRTGRAGKSGRVITFLNPHGDERKLMELAETYGFKPTIF